MKASPTVQSRKRYKPAPIAQPDEKPLRMKLLHHDIHCPEHEHRPHDISCLHRFKHFLHSKGFHITIVLLCALDGLLVITMLLLEIEILKLVAIGESSTRELLKKIQFILECTSLSIVSLFIIEIVVNIAVFGIKFYIKQCLELLDAIVCIVSFSVDIYNIVRHVQHGKHHHHEVAVGHHTEATTIAPNSTVISMPAEGGGRSSGSVQNPLADAANLIILFRLWRIVRIVNSIVISISKTHEDAAERLKHHLDSSQRRVNQLERTLTQYNIPIPEPESEG